MKKTSHGDVTSSWLLLSNLAELPNTKCRLASTYAFPSAATRDIPPFRILADASSAKHNRGLSRIISHALVTKQAQSKRWICKLCSSMHTHLCKGKNSMSENHFWSNMNVSPRPIEIAFLYTMPAHATSRQPIPMGTMRIFFWLTFSTLRRPAAISPTVQ